MTGQIIRLDHSPRCQRQLDQVTKLEELAGRYKRRFGFAAFADQHGKTAEMGLKEEIAFWTNLLGETA